MMDSCPDEAELLAFISGAANPALEAHLRTCVVCQETVALVPEAPGPLAQKTVLRSGDLVDRFQIVAEAGRGGMGTVYEAFDPKLRRKIALKVLHTTDPLSLARLDIEARSLARLAHPNIIYVFDVGIFEDRVFMAMEFVEGQSLRSWLQLSPSEDEVVTMFLQAGEGLATAHRAGIVHRDFKPDNVLVGRDERVRVVDFGLARSEAFPFELGTMKTAAPLDLAVTATGLAVGTPAYMAPEQYLGDEITASADQFSFCISLTEALFGVRPFAGESAEEVRRSVVAGTFSVPRATSSSPYWPVIRRGLELRPSDRYLDIVDLLTELRAVRDKRLGRGSRSKTMVVLAAAAAVALLGGVALRREGPSSAEHGAPVLPKELRTTTSPLIGSADHSSVPVPATVSPVSSPLLVPSQAVAPVSNAFVSPSAHTAAQRPSTSSEKTGANGAPVLH